MVQATLLEPTLAGSGFSFRLSSRSTRRRRFVLPAPPVATLHQQLAQPRANIFVPLPSNRRLHGPSAFARAIDREPRQSHPDRDSSTDRSDWRSAYLSTCV